MHDPFRIEDLRANLASQRNFNKLRTVYSDRYPEIADYNSPQLWDKLNRRRPTSKNYNPMGYDRLWSVQSLIIGEGVTVLNVGCGAGDLEELIFKEKRIKNLKWFGTDISSLSIQGLKGRFPEGVFEVGDIKKIKFKNNYFDYVVTLEVLEHIPPSSIG